MADIGEKPRSRRALGGWKFIVAIVLILGYCTAAAYGLMSDTSIRGLTVKLFDSSRYCTTNQSTSLKTLNYNVRGAIWSASSIRTSLSHLSFSLSVDGSVIGTATQSDSSFGPGQSISFDITITHPTLNPTMLALSSRLVLTLSATVTAGFYSANGAASDSTLQTFAGTGC